MRVAEAISARNPGYSKPVRCFDWFGAISKFCKFLKT